MLVEVTPDIGDAELARLIDQFAAHEDVTAWSVRLRGRLFVAVSGDERLIAAPDSRFVLGTWSTTARGYRLVAREAGVAPAAVEVGGSTVGAGLFWAASGPCALESFDDVLITARLLADAGVNALRMGLFKPRSSPYHFQGKGRAGLRLLGEVREAVGLPVVTEVLDPRDVAPVSEVADCLQVDTRNMANRALLAELGGIDRPVLLMRGLRSTVNDWLRAAEYVMSRGNPNIVLCARGIVSFDDSLAFQPDYGAILAVRRHTELPVIFDPSHSTGRADTVAPAALAAAVFGADGLLIESHHAPERIHQPGDGAQMYRPDRVADLLRACAEVKSVAAGIG
jgi:3-deoxy-7-phosphoheptulonate synthase